MTQIVTGEAVPVDLRVARLGSRLIAAVVDLLVQVVLVVLGTLAVRPLLLGSDADIGAAAELVLFLAVVLGYPVASETLSRGRSLGKAALGLRVVRDDGGPERFRHALVRGLVGAVVERPGVSLGLVAVVCSLVSTRGKRWGDVLAGTVVLQERVPGRRAVVPPMPPHLAPWAGLLDLSRLPDPLALAVRQFLARAPQLNDAARERLGNDLVTAVRAVVTPEPPPGTYGRDYLAAVLAERRRREESRSVAPVPRVSAPPAPPPDAVDAGFAGLDGPVDAGFPVDAVVADAPRRGLPSGEPPPPGPFAAPS